jgi:hypothetical protein
MIAEDRELRNPVAGESAHAIMTLMKAEKNFSKDSPPRRKEK